MKKIALILFVTLIVNNYASAQGSIEEKLKRLIFKTFTYSDPNPTYKEESDSLQSRFQELLARYNAEQKPNNLSEISSLFLSIYRNSTYEFEDEVEERRLNMRKAFCFASIALISEPDKSLAFVDYSKLALTGNKENGNTEFIAVQYIGASLLRILIKTNQNQLSNDEIIKTQKILNKQSAWIEPEIRIATERLLAELEQNFN